MPNGTSATRRARRARQAAGFPADGGILLPDIGEIQQVAGSWYSTAVGAAAKGLQSAVSARERLVKAQGPFMENVKWPGLGSRISTAYETLMGMRRR